MTRVVKIEDIILDIWGGIGEDDFDITIDDVDIITSQEFYNIIAASHYDKSFVSHLPKTGDYTAFKTLWNNYVMLNYSEWVVLYNAAIAEIDPTLDYAQTKVFTPNTIVSGAITHGLVQTNSGTLVNQLQNGKTITNNVNTFDGTLRNESSSAYTGTDTNTATDTRATTNSGTDLTSTTTTGTNTEEITGYRHSPVENMERYIALRVKTNLQDIIINGFCNSCLFYDNNNYREDVYPCI